METEDHQVLEEVFLRRTKVEQVAGSCPPHLAAGRAPHQEAARSASTNHWSFNSIHLLQCHLVSSFSTFFGISLSSQSLGAHFLQCQCQKFILLQFFSCMSLISQAKFGSIG